MNKRSMSQKTKGKDEWDEAKRRCSLSNEAVKMAKEIGLNPRSLIKNIPNKNEPWKAPVEDWIRNIYEKHKTKVAKKKARRDAQTETASSNEVSKPVGASNPSP